MLNGMDKARLRREYLEARRALTPAQAAGRSAAIIRRLRRLKVFREAREFLIYVASKDNEVDTKPLIRRLLKNGRPVCVPIAEPGGRIAWSRLIDLDDLEPARFGILEPRPQCRRIVPPPPAALVIVPGVAFTRDGWRIGYGGGFFDRFLAGHDGPSCALAYEMQLLDRLAPDPHDVPVDFVVTETRTYRRRGRLTHSTRAR